MVERPITPIAEVVVTPRLAGIEPGGCSLPAPAAASIPRRAVARGNDGPPPEGSPMTTFLFRDDAYAARCDAVVTATHADGVELDRTVFYGASGGQPGDTGTLVLPDGSRLAVADAVHPDGDRTRILHRLDGAPPEPGTSVTAEIDWDRRHRLMRMHTALHLLSVVLPYPVTGGAIGAEKSRLDFDMAAPPEDVAAIEAALAGHVASALPVTAEWITDEELAARPEMVKTMKVKPPTGQGRVRLVRIGAGLQTLDLQPCGGTHVRSTAEIGALRIGRIEKKGRENRRVHLHLSN
jgi:misacylated tRNA(Ala) deacylase